MHVMPALSGDLIPAPACVAEHHSKPRLGQAGSLLAVVVLVHLGSFAEPPGQPVVIPPSGDYAIICTDTRNLDGGTLPWCLYFFHGVEYQE